VDYDSDTGQHATVLELLYKVAGVNADYLRVPANKTNGNDHSEFGPEQTVNIA